MHSTANLYLLGPSTGPFDMKQRLVSLASRRAQLKL
jgi:hypothetical protein